MPLDVENQALVSGFAKLWHDHAFDLDVLRWVANPTRDPRAPPRPGAVEDRTIAGPRGEIPIRIYRPGAAKPAGVLVYFHGGGFVAGGLETVDALCAELTRLASCVTVSVDYRLAPEHRFPAGVEDAHAAMQWAIANARELAGGSPVAVGGDSAGGTLATMACQMARDRGQPAPIFQLLFYPGINLDWDTPERTAMGDRGYILTPAFINWLNSFYCASPEDFEKPYCTPVRSADLGRLPPALLITGEYDPLRYEAADYAARLRASGVAADYSQYAGAVHGFVTAFEINQKGRQALEEASQALSGAFRPVP